MNINELYTRLRDGDKSAEAELFAELTDRFRVFAHLKIWNKEEAEEIVQNALATVLSEYRRIEITATFAAWAHKVLENKFLAYIQKKRRQGTREASVEDMDLMAGNWTPDPTLKMRLLNCLKRVGRTSNRYARILNLHHLGFSRVEVCKKLGMTAQQSYVVMSRARAMLRECLDKGKIGS